MKLKYRLLILAFIVGVFLIYKAFPCVMVSVKGFPGSIIQKMDQNGSIVIFLYGSGVCGTCPSGQLVSELSEKEIVLFLVPEELTDNDIENLRSAFEIKGTIARGNPESVNFLQRVSNCSKLDSWKKNFYAELDEKKKMKFIKDI